MRSGSSDWQSRTGERLPARINLADGDLSGNTDGDSGGGDVDGNCFGDSGGGDVDGNCFGDSGGGDVDGDPGGDTNPSRSCSVTRLFSAATFFLHGLLEITYNSRNVCKKQLLTCN